jgi:transposase
MEGTNMKPYSLDLRQRAVEAYEENPNASEVARRLGVSHTWVENIVRLFEQTGSLEPQYQNCGRPPTIGEREKQWLRGWLKEESGLTLKELQERLAAKGVKVSHTTIDNAFKAMNITRKKKTTVAEEQNRPDVRRKRKLWFRKIAKVPANHLVFLDESGANTKMHRLYGRSIRGKRAYGEVPHSHYISVTMICAVRLSGVFAAHSFVGSMNGKKFCDWVKTSLAPGLVKGDVVIMDNLSAHKNKDARKAIEAVGARVEFLPEYSPDFNPSENVWSKTKTTLRRMGKRTVDGLLSVIDTVVSLVTPSDCKGYIEHCGYG